MFAHFRKIIVINFYREIEGTSYLIILNVYAIKKKKKIDPMAIAKTSCEDFREMKSESRNDQPELIFKMVGLR